VAGTVALSNSLAMLYSLYFFEEQLFYKENFNKFTSILHQVDTSP
jgi:hypothetical protein